MLTMLDLCSGFGGASEAMKLNGWRVVRLDNEPRVKPDIVADLLALPIAPRPFDLIWASPPCTFYSRHDQPGVFKNEPEPDHSLYQAALAVIAEFRPRFWVVENVRGAIRYWGQPTYQLGSYKLWTNLPFSPMGGGKLPRKETIKSTKGWARSATRGRIPYALSDSVRSQIEALS